MNIDGIKKAASIILIVLLLVIIGVTFGGREKVTKLEDVLISIVSPMQKALNNVDSALQDSIGPILNVWKNQKKVEELKVENELLKKQVIENALTTNQLNELRDLKKMFNFLSADQLANKVTGRVISFDSGNIYNTFTIDIGSKQGIVKDSTVVAGQGLVGLVYEVGENWSRVVSITDNKVAIGFETMSTYRSYDGVVQGARNEILGGFIYDQNADVMVGDMLVTSGKGIYPKGIIIGKISKVIENGNNIVQAIEITSGVDFKNLDIVTVIPYQKEGVTNEE